jgi:dTDP-4-dehydrorhamnose 3,5-epimerase
MQFVPLEIAGLVLIRPSLHQDERGVFFECWHSRKFADAGIDVAFVQENHSRSRQGTLRGLHYQLERPQGKLVRAVTGTIYDVAVDMRRSSPTFGRWAGLELSEENCSMLWIPPGFAHGFLALSETAQVAYLCTEHYDAASERAVLWSDPALGIRWPVVPGGRPLLSPKDARAGSFERAESFE